jgi:serine/threonine protein kinase
MLKAGTILEKYEIIEPIAAGGMGIVYRAKHTTIGREVAVKLLLDNYALSEKVRRRFEQEAYVQAQLDHSNIVRVHDLVREPQTLAIVMDFISGVSLADCLQDEKTSPWSVAETLSVMDPVVKAIVYAHDRGVIHRDIKPGNILLDRRSGIEGLGTPKVTDFGLAKILTDTEQHTKTGSKMGTLPYMAPEQFQGLKSIGPQADLYALAMMTWRLLAGTLPIPPDDMIAACNLYTGQNPMPALSPLNPEVTSLLEEALAAGLFIDQDARPKSVQSWWNNLKRASQSDASDAQGTALNDPDADTEQVVVATDSDISIEDVDTDHTPEGQLRSWGDTPRGPGSTGKPSQDSATVWPIIIFFAVIIALGAFVGKGQERQAVAQHSSSDTRTNESLKRACDMGSIDACRNLAIRFRDGTGVEQSTERAKYWFEEACTLKDPTGCTEGAALHHDTYNRMGKYDSPTGKRAYLRAMLLYRKACDLGVQTSCEQWRLLK